MMAGSSDPVKFFTFVLVTVLATDGAIYRSGQKLQTPNSDIKAARERRAMPVPLQFQGNLATRKLLHGAKPARTQVKDQLYRNYSKKGDFELALKEFKSLKPERVKEKIGRNQGKEYEGFVGDRKIKLREKGAYTKGRPTIEIFGYVPGVKIIYKD